MNRRERRALERQGKVPKKEPAYMLKPSEIKDLVLSGTGKQALMHEINQQCIKADKSVTLDMDTLYIWTLHQKYGWGVKRLKQFYKDVFEEHLKMREYYELDDLYPERFKLKEKGIDIEAWYNEFFNEDGSFKEDKVKEVQS